MKNILFIVHTFPPAGTVGGSIRLMKFLKYISDLRKDIFSHVVTINDKIVLLNDPHNSISSLKEIPEERIKIYRTNTFQPRHPYPSAQAASGITGSQKKNKKSRPLPVRILKKAYNVIEKNFLIPDYGILWYFHLAKEIKKILSKTKIDLIYATAPPFSTILSTSLIRRKYDIPLIIDIKDDWIYQPSFKAKNPVARAIERKMEKYCIKRADKVITVTAASNDDFKERYKVLQDKFHLITNGCDVAEYEKYFNYKKEKNNKFTVIHSGVIGESRDTSGFFQGIKHLILTGKISKDSFELIFIGKLPSHLTEIISSPDLEGLVKNINYLEREDYIKKILNADLLLAFNYQIKTLIPGKIYDYWGSRNPVLLVDSLDSAAARLVSDNKLGAIKNFNDADGIASIIEKYYTEWKRNIPFAKSDVKNLYNYDRKLLTEKLLSLVDSI